jgi:tetratricopeptide (TPR) repeat protein
MKQETPEQNDLPGQGVEDRLDGWKRIAAYLNRDVRTARRWEKQQGLPVRRVMHDKQATVYAYRSELDAWLRQQDNGTPVKPPSSSAAEDKPARRWAWLVAPLLILAGMIAWYWPQGEQQSIAFGEWDWVLITQFDNRTGEAILDGTVEYALQRELANSSFVKVAPQSRISDALRLMKLPQDTPLDVGTAREISLRDGGIRMLIAGRVERLGGTYSVSTELVNPADGVNLASFTAQAGSQDEILPLVAELARNVREALGESLASIEASTEMLARVTTPSLEALRLYSEADRIMRGRDRVRAVPVLEQAVRIDPDFASAYLLMTYVLRDRDEVDRARETLQRAVELAEQASERERLFILATYYRYLEDIPREIETYELLTRLYPDHTWASGNLGHRYSWLGRKEEAYIYKKRNAELAPNDFFSQYQVALWAIINNDQEAIGPVADKARELAGNNSWIIARLDFLPVHGAWIQGDYAEAARLTEEIIADLSTDELVSNGQLYAQARSLFIALGQLERFRELNSLRPQIGWLQAIIDYDSGHPGTLNQYLDGEVGGFWDAGLMALAGRVGEARMLIEDPRAVEYVPPPFMQRDWRKFAKGHLALAEGRFTEAVELLGTETMMLFISAPHAHQLAMNSLARAYLGLGQQAKAIETLEQARPRGILTIVEPGATWFWLRNQVLLYRLYRDTGDTTRAEIMAGELHEALRQADDGHPFLLVLED